MRNFAYKRIQGRQYFFDLDEKIVLLCGDFRILVKLDDGECGSWGNPNQVLYFLMKKLEQLLNLGNFSMFRFVTDSDYWNHLSN